MKIHLALASAFRTEADARAAFGFPTAGIPYRGLWFHPTPERPVVHVISEAEPSALEALGWVRWEPAESADQTAFDQGTRDTTSKPTDDSTTPPQGTTT